jgi:hypothetical protein
LDTGALQLTSTMQGPAGMVPVPDDVPEPDEEPVPVVPVVPVGPPLVVLPTPLLALLAPLVPPIAPVVPLWPASALASPVVSTVVIPQEFAQAMVSPTAVIATADFHVGLASECRPAGDCKDCPRPSACPPSFVHAL